MTDLEAPWLNDREMQVWRRWLRVQTELPAALGRALNRETGLSMQDFETLVRLSEAPEARLRISTLADQMHWERSRLSHHLRRMAARGLIDKENCKEDGRGAFVVLTAVGQSALEEAAPGHVRAVREIFLDGLGQGRLDQLDAILEQIVDRLAALPDEN